MSFKSKAVFVGLSGGVDSAVAAALLLREGARVRGVFIKGWYPPGMPCTGAEDRRDAIRVAAHLGIPFSTFDASSEYKAGVIDYLLREYGAARTPNPDVMRNREVKFGAFLRFASEHGADLIATGHYARAERGSLLRGIDRAKDQSYFLWAVPKNAIAQVSFPLGVMRKEETRAIARRLGLPVAAKKDSQGICFLGDISVDAFLEKEFGSEPGEAADQEGVMIGRHAGVLRSTLGARVALSDAPPGPWYVVAKDVRVNRLIVSRDRVPRGTPEGIRLVETNWFDSPDEGRQAEAQYRYRGPRVPGTISDGGTCFVADAPVAEPLAPGQPLVLYDRDRVLGGGVIA